MKALNDTNQMKVPPVRLHSVAPPSGDAGRPVEQEGRLLPVADIPQRLRLLRWDEVVGRGDYVANERRGFDLWDGPTGFRADAYVRQIYRLVERRFTREMKEAP